MIFFNRKFILFIVLQLFNCYSLFSQTIIKMRKENGVFFVPCKINGLSLDFIFDTGASDVSISSTEAMFMLKNGMLTKDDILGSERFADATGAISEGVVINLKSVEIQGMVLYNVKATIVNSATAPLLLGQSAISKLGKVEIDFNKNTLCIHSNGTTNTKNNYKVGQKYLGGLVVGYIEKDKLLLVTEKDISLGTTYFNALKLEKSYQGNSKGWRLPTHIECNFMDSVLQKNNSIKIKEIPGISNCSGCNEITFVNDLLIDFKCAYYWTSTIANYENSNGDKLWAFNIGEHSATARSKERISAVRFVKIVNL